MGFLSKLIGGTVKAALTPIAVVKDAVEVATGGDSDNTKDLLESAGDDLANSVDDLSDGDLV